METSGRRPDMYSGLEIENGWRGSSERLRAELRNVERTRSACSRSAATDSTAIRWEHEGIRGRMMEPASAQRKHCCEADTDGR